MERREEQPGAAGAGAAPALDFTVENVEKVRGPWGGHSSDRAEVLGPDTNARAQAWAGCPLGWCPQSTWHLLSLWAGRMAALQCPNGLFLACLRLGFFSDKYSRVLG